MSAAQHTPRSSLRDATTWLAVLVIVAAGMLAYGNGFEGVFLFDDHTDIDGNAAILRLWPPWRVVLDQGQSGVSGRPVVALSYAVDYARNGFEVWGWHATNLSIHLAAALALFGVVRRALNVPSLCARWGGAATAIAFATALLWVVHPLTTASVMYLGQRVESMMGMFFLVAFYCALRGFEAERPARWYAASVAATMLSAGCKEVAVVVPVLVLLFDATFVAGSFPRAWRERRGLYLGLFATWAWIALLVLTAQGRSESVGFDYQHVGVWSYLKTQAWAVVRYLRLSVWPSPLVFDYGKRPVSEVAQWLPHGVFLVLLLAATVAGLVRRKGIAYLGAWWFVILAPTSSVLPIVTELIVEHRAYLPLAAVVLLAVLGSWAAIERVRAAPSVRGAVWGALVLATATALALATRARNVDYRDEMGMWADVVEKLPTNDRAHASYANNWIFVRNQEQQLAQQASAQGRTAEARAHREAERTAFERAGHHFGEAARLAPEDPDWHTNLGAYHLECGRIPDAIRELEQAREARPDFGLTLQCLGFAYARNGEVERAIASFEGALEHGAPNPDAVQSQLASLKAQRGR